MLQKYSELRWVFKGFSITYRNLSHPCRYIDFLCRMLSSSDISLLKALEAQSSPLSPGYGSANTLLSAANGAEADLKCLRKANGAPIIPPEKLSYLFGVWRMEGDAQHQKV